MAAVEEVARSVLAALNSQAGLLLASKWVSDRYRQLASRTRFRHLREVGYLNVPAPITAGTVTATRDSRIVTGDATAQAAWTPSIVGRHIRVSLVWYEIEALTTQSELRLKSEYAEDTVSGGTYNIVGRWLSLDEDARWLGDFVHVRRRVPLARSSLYELDLYEPARRTIGAGPEKWAELTPAPDGTKRVELYPYADQSEMVGYVFWSAPPTLGFRDPIPPTIDPHVLREGALIDAMRYEMAQAMRRGQVEVAAVWRNEYRAQATSWERDVLEAIRADRGSDDVTFILELARSMEFRDLMTARDEVYDRWPE